MSNYTKATNFTAKDSLTTGDPSKVVLGSEFDTEFTAIETAVATKADLASPTFTGTVGLPTTSGNRTDSGNITRTGTTTFSGKSLWTAEGASVASASDCNIWTTDGNTVHITGTTTITDWGTAPQAGAWKRVIFDDALQLTYNATTNDLPGDANIMTVANDSCIVYARSTSSYQIFDYTPSSGPVVARPSLQTAVATTSGTSVALSTTVPSWAKKITVMFFGVSTSGNSGLILQIGDSGGLETSGYLGAVGSMDQGVVTNSLNRTNGFALGYDHADTLVRHGAVTLTLFESSSNTWVMSGNIATSDGPKVEVCGGSKALSATLDRITLTTNGGSDTFDAGAVSLMFE